MRYTKEWAEPNTKHYETLFRKIKDSVNEIEGILVQRNEMINYIEELHDVEWPKQPSPNEGFGKYDPPKEKITYPHDSGPIKKPENIKHWEVMLCRNGRDYNIEVHNKYIGYFSPFTVKIAAYDFKKALNELLEKYPQHDILQLVLIHNH
jgi:hypothetical protein